MSEMKQTSKYWNKWALQGIPAFINKVRNKTVILGILKHFTKSILRMHYGGHMCVKIQTIPFQVSHQL